MLDCPVPEKRDIETWRFANFAGLARCLEQYMGKEGLARIAADTLPKRDRHTHEGNVLMLEDAIGEELKLTQEGVDRVYAIFEAAHCGDDIGNADTDLDYWG